MSATKTLSTAWRILSQLRHDHRTLALIIFIPSILLTIFRFVFQNQQPVFQAIAPQFLGIFPLIIMFIVTSVAMLRERRTGTLDRLMTMPISKADLVLGYMLAFSLLALTQVALACVVLLGFLDVPVAGSTLQVVLAALIAAMLGTALGLFVSAFASSEFQAVQFMPAFVLPQLLLCGLFAARADMARPLQWLANVLPMTYSVDAMKQVTLHTGWTSEFLQDVAIVSVYVIGVLVLGALTIRRQEA
ncbi:MAG TPA: ABC transporter permease [Candidatus Limnocylindria bacterium]|nr:ABC transporter permease [Candidatus Limnocylindria bacterium]